MPTIASLIPSHCATETGCKANLNCSMVQRLPLRIWPLSILPYFMTTAAKKHGLENKIVILTATSAILGAMAGFADVPGTEIIVFYPKDGVSKVQSCK